MNLIERYQDEVYSLALSLTNDEKKAANLALKVFEETLPKVYGSHQKIKLKLFKAMLSKTDGINPKKIKGSDFLTIFKRKLNVFDRNVFVLKYEFDLKAIDIAFVLEVSKDRVKKSLLFGIDKVARKMETK
jgi:DNA-directed RNA polymerase specialized sigma24 family protein